MNFGSVLYVAQNNTCSSERAKDVRCYKTTFEPPKKEVKTKTLSANVQKFLQKQEEDKRKKEVEATAKRQELLALRSQDKMSQKRMSTMLKRTKSANKSVMEDAIDDVNTSVTMAGPSQPDEDDYGYVSQEASSFYDKLMNKYSSMPAEEPLFAKPKKPVVKDLNAAKERVRAALNRVEEEELMPKKRKRKTKEERAEEQGGGEEKDDFIDDGELTYSKRDAQTEEEEERKPKKVKRPAPPPMDFMQLLKIAEQKQHEPVVIEKKKRGEEEDEEDKPMTKRQKLEYLREKEARIQRERRRLEESLGGRKAAKPQRDRTPPPRVSGGGLPRIPKTGQASQESSNKSSMRIPKLGDKERSEKTIRFDNTKPVPSSVAEDALRKGSDVWSKPCNLSPSSSKFPNRPLTASTKMPDRRTELNNGKISKIADTSHHELDRRKESSSKSEPREILKKALSSSGTARERKESPRPVDRVSSSGKERVQQNNLDRRKEPERARAPEGRSPHADSSGRKKAPPASAQRPDRNLPSGKERIQQELETRREVEKTRSLNKQRLPDSDRLKDDRAYNHKASTSSTNSKLNGSIRPQLSSSSKPLVKDEKLGRLPTTQSRGTNNNNNSKLKPVDLFGDDFPDSSNGEDERGGQQQVKQVGSSSNNKSNASSVGGNNNGRQVANGSRPQISSSSPTISQGGRPSLLKGASLAGREREAKANALKSAGDDRLKAHSSPSATQRPSDRTSGSGKPPNGVRPPRSFPPSDARQRPPSEGGKAEGQRPSQVRPRQFPPPDVRSRQFPPADVRGRQPPPSNARGRPYRSPPRRRPHQFMADTDSDEYDSEMDDFIDDGEGDQDVDVSGVISEIFRYDKSRYRNVDDDDECMESSFGQIDKEEYKSLQIGLREDLADIMQEKAEKQARVKKLQKLADSRKRR